MKNVVKILRDLGEAVVMCVLMAIGVAVLLVVMVPFVVVWLMVEVVRWIVEYAKCKRDSSGDMRGEAAAENSASDSDAARDTTGTERSGRDEEF